MMAASAFQLGIFDFDQRQSDSHAYSPILPSTLLETQCTNQFFQQPPPRPLLPPISPRPPFLIGDLGLSRQHWQTLQQSIYVYGGHDPAGRSNYDIVDSLQSYRITDNSAERYPDLHYPHTQRDPAFCSDFRRDEGDLFLPLSRHSRPLTGIPGQSLPPMSSEHQHNTGVQDLCSPAQSFTEESHASSSCPMSHSIAKSRNPATGCYSSFSVLDTPIDAVDFVQNEFHSLSGKLSSSDFTSADAGGDVPGNSGSSNSGPNWTKKQRSGKGRERARIALAPDQPPTTQGKQRERVYVACQQCRNRKIRCDGAKPMCYNCDQRGIDICEFDPIPKRRGPDRLPGARQRHGKFPGPRVRRRCAKYGNQESPSDPLVSSVHHGLRSMAPHDTDKPYGTWAPIPSPPSTTSTTGPGYSYDQYTPGSSGSDASQVSQGDYRNPLIQPFAYGAPQGNYAESAKPHLRNPVPRISTDSVAPISVSQPSGTFLQEILGAIPYPPFTSHYSSQTSPCTETTPSLLTGLSTSSLDNITTLDGVASPDSLEFGDFIPHDINFVQPVVVNQEPVISATYADFDIFAGQQQGYGSHPIVSDSCSLHARRDSFSHVNPDSYNPYQWAVHRDQDSSVAYISTSEDEETAATYEFSITQTPSLDFVRKTWWDSLLDSYCTEPYCTPSIAGHYERVYGLSVTIPRGTYAVGASRQQVAQIIVRDLQSSFKDSIFWFSFFNVPLFFGTFFRMRETMQPALVLAVLMFSNYLRSSTLELGEEGMRRTDWLRGKAQAALDASVNASWIDPGLAQAAWLLALFEISSQPMRSVARLHSAISTLDNIVRSLALTFIDAQSPPQSASADPTSSLPCIPMLSNLNASRILPMPLYNRRPVAGTRVKYKNSSQLLQYHFLNPGPHNLRHQTSDSIRSTSEPTTCVCGELSLGRNWPEAKDHVPFWLNSPAWKSTWTDAEVRREECRRLCWNTLHLLASYTTYRTSLGLQHLDLFLLHPSNVHNIFPGENLTDLSTTSSPPKHETVWALYARAILLWHACLRIRNVSDRERAVFAHSVWLEADAIENALDGHSCNTERSFLYHGREYLFNARMYVSSEFRRFVPHPSPDMSGAVHRKKAEDWLTHQATVAKRSMQGLQALTGVRGSLLAKRPFFCFWFMGHVSRCLQLWQVDKTLTVALQLAKHFLSPINYLSALWPCQDQQIQYATIRSQLEGACREAGVALPPPVDPTFPLPSSLTGTL